MNSKKGITICLTLALFCFLYITAEQVMGMQEGQVLEVDSGEIAIDDDALQDDESVNEAGGNEPLVAPALPPSNGELAELSHQISVLAEAVIQLNTRLDNLERRVGYSEGD